MCHLCLPDTKRATDITEVVATRHTLCALIGGECHFFDLMSGVLMSSVKVLTTVKRTPDSDALRFWGPTFSDPTTQCGVWNRGLFMQIMWPSPTVYSDALVARAGEDKVSEENDSTETADAAALSAVSVCADWGLDQWVAQNALDILLKRLPNRNVETVARALGKQMQNPALIAALLADRNKSR